MDDDKVRVVSFSVPHKRQAIDDEHRRLFYQKYNEHTTSHPATKHSYNRVPDHEKYNEIYDAVINFNLIAKKEPKHYKWIKKYVALEVEGRKCIMTIEDSKKIPQAEGVNLSNIRRTAYYEELYDAIKKCHLAGDHGKVKKTYTDVMKNFSNISREVVQIYVSLCACQNQNKRAQRRKSIAVLSEGFNTRGIVKVLAMEKSDNHYHYILSYYDSYTKFLYLRPLVEKNVETITMILLEIFLMQGAPRLLQCCDMLISDVTQQLKALWPGCHILYSVADVDDGMPAKILECLQQWMHSTRGTSWSHGLYFVAHQLNSAISGDLGTTPYYLQYGRHMTVGIADLQLPAGQFETFTTEEELRQYFLSLQHNDMPPAKRLREVDILIDCDCNGTCDNCPCNAANVNCPCSIISGAERLPVTSTSEV